MKKLIVLMRQFWALRPFIAIILLLSAFIWALNHKSDPKTYTQSTSTTVPQTPEQIAASKAKSDRHDAKWKAREFVEASLKAPSTAKWPNYNDFAAAPKKGKPGVWEVMGHVDAQNSYGAMLRNEFMVTMQKNGEDWKLMDVYLL
jgi:hypothetical protein